MKKLAIIGCIAAGLLLGSCTALEKQQKVGAAVEVNGQYLYRSTLDSLTVGLSSEDSLRMVQQYISQWTKDVLEYDKAKARTKSDLEKLVEEYRRALYVQAYEQQLIERHMPKAVPDSVVMQVYEQMPNRFLLDESIVKGILVVVPKDARDIAKLRGWMAKEQARGISDSTLRGDRSIFMAYFGWLHREGLIERNPVGNLDPIKCQKKKKKVYSAVEMEKLDDECDESNFRYALRNRAIVSFLESTGCRISEMTGLDREDVNLNTLEVVVNGKGNKQRKVYMSEVTGMLLKEYLDSRKDNEPCLFVGAQLERFHPGGVRAMLNKLAKYADVEHVHPHKFRRTLATSLNRRGMPIEQVAAILGHEKLDTTMQYVVLNDEDTKNYYRRFT